MAKDMTDADIADLSFEAALDELEKIVRKLEGGEVALQESIAVYDRGEKLKKHCATLLQAAEDKVEKIRVVADGSAKGTEPLDG